MHPATIALSVGPAPPFACRARNIYIAMSSPAVGGAPRTSLALIATLPISSYTLYAAPDLTANGPASACDRCHLKTGAPRAPLSRPALARI